MKKLLSLLTIGTLSTSILPTTNLILNTKVNNNIYSKLTDQQTFTVNLKGIIKWQSVSKSGQFIWLAKKDVVGENNIPDFFWDAGLGSSISVHDDSIWEKIGVVYGFSKSASDNEIHKLMNSKPVINATITIEKNNNNLSLKDFSAKYSPVNLDELRPKADYYDENKKTLIYKDNQEININDDYLSNAVLDGKVLTIPLKNIALGSGSHFLKLTLKEEYKDSAVLFDGDNKTGNVLINYLIKTSIDQTEFNFKTTTDDTELLTGLTSNSGNTNNTPIIQTKAKDGSGFHNANLNIVINSDLIDLSKSFYITGTVDDQTNNFTENGKRIGNLSKEFLINNDGIYHFQLIDVVGNVYDSYLELGEKNWQLTGTFSDKDLTDLSSKLNVTVNLITPADKQKAMSWLQNYQVDADKALNKSIKDLGKGFNLSIFDFENGYKDFLDPITYTNTDNAEAINQTRLNQIIANIAQNLLKDGLDKLPQNLNVATDNVVNKLTLESYSTWIKEYEKFVNSTKDQWINDAVALSSRGFATEEEKQNIKDHIESLKFSDYLENITWTPNANTPGYGASNDFLQYVKLDKLDKDAIEWTNNNLPNINQAYELALKTAETDLNLHGYSIDTILNGKPLPKTKGEIDNFANGISFHDYLQTQANSKFHGWQLQMGLGIGLPLLLVAAGIGIIIRWRTDPRYNPLARARKDVRADKKAAKKGQ